LNTFRIGDTAVQLARRNGKQQAAECLSVLCSGCGVPVFSPDEARIAMEDRLLKAIRNDDADAVLRILEQVDSTRAKVALGLRVKQTLGDEADASAFFHSVASYGLEFAIGDTAHKLAERSGSTNAARALKAKERRLWDTSLPEVVVGTAHVILQSVSGETLAQFDRRISGTVRDLCQQCDDLAPLPPGCLHRSLTRGETYMDPKLPLATYVADGQHAVLTSVTVSGGIYISSTALPDLPGPLAGRHLYRRGGGTRTIVKLMRSGVAKFSFTVTPADTGHCAGTSGGRQVQAAGMWAMMSDGVRVSLGTGTEATMSHGHWMPGQAIDFDQDLMFAQEEDGLVSLPAPLPDHLSSSLAVRVPAGLRLQRVERA